MLKIGKHEPSHQDYPRPNEWMRKTTCFIKSLIFFFSDRYIYIRIKVSIKKRRSQHTRGIAVQKQWEATYNHSSTRTKYATTLKKSIKDSKPIWPSIRKCPRDHMYKLEMRGSLRARLVLCTPLKVLQLPSFHIVQKS